MASISNRESMKRWLEGKPIQWSGVVSMRAALRVAPLLVSALRPGSGGDATARASIILPAFRGMAVSWVAGMWPARANEFDIVIVAGSAATNVAAARAAAAVVYPHAYAYATATAAAAASAAVFACTPSDNARDAVFAGCDALAYAAHAVARVSSSSSAYAETSVDAQALDKGMSSTELAGERLWSDRSPSWGSDSWRELKQALLKANEGWDGWTEWYEDRLEGRPADQLLEVSRVGAAEKIWTGGPKIANDYIKRLKTQAEAVDRWDFFLSYSKHDEAFARWIKKLMSAAGFRIFSQFSKMPAGANFVQEMQRGLTHSARFIAIQSPAYTNSNHCNAEWNAAYNMDPTGEQRKLLQFLVRPTELPPLARQIVYKSLIDLSPADAAAAVLDTVGYHGDMPVVPPAWPTR